MSLTVIFYSVVSVLTSLARGFYSFATFRFLLGAGESANWPAATKAVSEWFPAREGGLATALFDSGSSVGGAIASWLILALYFRWGWRPAFAIPGMLGFVWVLAWRWLYHPPESHPRISDAERAMILADKQESPSTRTPATPAAETIRLNDAGHQRAASDQLVIDNTRLVGFVSQKFHSAESSHTQTSLN